MSYHIHSSARRISLPQFTFKSNFYNNPFLNKQFFQRRHSSVETEDCLSTLSKESEENHIRQLGEVIIRPSKFQLILDIDNLCHKDLKVRAFTNGFFVTAIHREILENGNPYITQHFYREYLLPKRILAKETTAWISLTDNLLFVEAPKQISDEKKLPDSDIKLVKSDNFDNYKEFSENEAVDIEILLQD